MNTASSRSNHAPRKGALHCQSATLSTDSTVLTYSSDRDASVITPHLADAGDEEWRSVPGWPGYEVSSLGRVRNASTGRVLQPVLSGPGGYLRVARHRPGQTPSNHLVHRLVAMAFIGTPRRGECVRHLDGCPTNNRASNLAIGTPAENSADMIAHGRSLLGARNHLAQISEADAAAIYLSRETANVLSATYGIQAQSIRLIWRGVTWPHVAAKYGPRKPTAAPSHRCPVTVASAAAGVCVAMATVATFQASPVTSPDQSALAAAAGLDESQLGRGEVEAGGLAFTAEPHS